MDTIHIFSGYRTPSSASVPVLLPGVGTDHHWTCYNLIMSPAACVGGHWPDGSVTGSGLSLNKQTGGVLSNHKLYLLGLQGVS